MNQFEGLKRLKDVDGLEIKVEVKYPPNIDAIDKVLPGTKRNAIPRSIYFCYGHTIYNPSGRPIPIHLMAHEATHVCQQVYDGRDKWWDKYLADTKFRYQQELEAHLVEFEKYVLDNPNRHSRRAYVKIAAQRLSGPLYGKLITRRAAEDVFRAFAKELRGEDVDC